ncbi:MAG: T9SS type A sorting domain-containing protein [Ignavibacteriaceae bacterium]|nr:T9SS type A sorting domain-containing protein [Ignavibacteriaceae bacterium]
MKQIDFDGTVSYSEEIEIDVTGPKEFTLYQNYPNPFNPSTTIKFALPERTNIEIAVYNSLGEKVADVLKSELSEGYHEVNFSASNLSSGIYFYRLESEKFVSVKKMIIIK